MIAALLLGVASLDPSAQLRNMEVSVRDLDGERVCSVHASGERADSIVLALATQAGLTLQGLGAMDMTEPIDVELVDRPLNQAVGVIFGAVGLRARFQGNVVVLEPDSGGGANADELEAMAEAAYLRTLRASPDGDDAAATEFALGDIQARRKNDDAARTHYDTLAKIRPDSPLATEALWRAGSILQARGEWSEAAVRFSRLANLPNSSSYATKARLQLARSLANAGDGQQALILLEALDRLFPTSSKDERGARLAVRASALCAAGRASEALSTLDEALRFAPDLAVTADSLRLRAEALERGGQSAAAARAWLTFAQSLEGAPRQSALEKSARLALDVGDFLGVLFLERAAAGSGAEETIAPLAARAREHLGLDAAKDPLVGARLAQAEELTVLGGLAEAEALVEPLWNARAALAEDDLARVALVHARALDATNGTEAAITVLRDALPSLKDVALRKRVYLLAGELYEHRERFDLAVEAYGGHL